MCEVCKKNKAELLYKNKTYVCYFCKTDMVIWKDSKD